MPRELHTTTDHSASAAYIAQGKSDNGQERPLHAATPTG